MSKSIHEIIKESLIDELNANHIKTDDLVKIVEDIKGGFDSVLELSLIHISEPTRRPG